MSHYVCFTGGRDLDNEDTEAAMDDIVRFMSMFYGVGLRIMHGGATGIDAVADRAAVRYDVTRKAYPADWGRGRRAGPERNKKMAGLLVAWAQQGHSVEVIAFPGGRGTKHMADLSEKLGLNVTYIDVVAPPEPVYEQPTLGAAVE